MTLELENLPEPRRSETLPKEPRPDDQPPIPARSSDEEYEESFSAPPSKSSSGSPSPPQDSEWPWDDDDPVRRQPVFDEPPTVPRLGPPPRRGKRLVKKPDPARATIKPPQRLLLLDIWKRSGLPAIEVNRASSSRSARPLPRRQYICRARRTRLLSLGGDFGLELPQEAARRSHVDTRPFDV